MGILFSAVVLGLLFGSFLNVCIVRLPQNASIVSPRSRCVGCGASVRWFDNIPLLSFALLRGRCRDCRAHVSGQYPLVEAMTAAWFGLCAATPARLLATPGTGVDPLLGSFAHAAGLCAFGFLLIGLAVMDWQTGLLPNEFTIGGGCVGIFFAFTESFFLPSVPYKTFFTPEEVFIFRRVGAALAAGLLLWLIGALYRLVRKRPGLGAGDIKMLAMIGAFLGFGETLLAFFLGIAGAAFAGVALLATRRGTGSTRLPFGSYLAVGGLVAGAFGPTVLAWYTGLFR